MLNEHTDVEATEVLADKSTLDHTEAYVAQLQLQSSPSALYHFQLQFAGKSRFPFMFSIYVLLITFGNPGSVLQLLATKNARTLIF